MCATMRRQTELKKQKAQNIDDESEKLSFIRLNVSALQKTTLRKWKSIHSLGGNIGNEYI